VPRPAQLLIAAAACSAVACSGGGGEAPTPAEPAEPPGRFVVLGFDGVDPDLVEQMWLQGELPELKALATSGTFSRLRSTTPPQSPVAWATFATGVLPGEHGVFDFIARDPFALVPKMGFVEYQSPTFDVYGEPVGTLQGRNLRRGDSFWSIASAAGVEVRVINVPYTWPPEPVPHGGVASGLGLPDLRPTNSTSTVFSTDFPTPAPSFGGVRAVPLTVSGGTARGTLEGPHRKSGGRSTCDVGFRLDDSKPGLLHITTSTAALAVQEGTWSEWILIDLPVGATRVVKGQVRFFVEAASADRLHVYAAPVSSDPADPWVPLSHPPALARELMADAGRYKTVGWEEDTQVLNVELLGEEAWLQDVHTIMEQRTAMALAALDRGAPPLFISVWTGPDRVSHMLWRLTDPASPRYDAALAATYGEAIRDTYREMDRIVGEVRSRLADGTTLIVLSDHGFHAWHQQVHVNRWLIDNGYLVMKPGQTSVLMGADWSQTRAYALGTGQIYLNLQGRERGGIVSFGQPRQELLSTLQAELLALTDPVTGAPVLSAVELGEQAYSGAGTAGAPDLVLGFAPGYQSSWATRLGGVGDTVFEDNGKKWSGDHAASDASVTRGVLFVSTPVSAEEPGIEDIAPTVLKGLGLPLPNGLDGRPLL